MNRSNCFERSQYSRQSELSLKHKKKLKRHDIFRAFSNHKQNVINVFFRKRRSLLKRRLIKSQTLSHRCLSMALIHSKHPF